MSKRVHPIRKMLSGSERCMTLAAAERSLALDKMVDEGEADPEVLHLLAAWKEPLK